jgi:hypothetical protein
MPEMSLTNISDGWNNFVRSNVLYIFNQKRVNYTNVNELMKKSHKLPHI